MILDNFEVNKSFAKEDLKAVFYLNEHTVCDTHDLIRCDCESGRAPEDDDNDSTIEDDEEGDKAKKKKKVNQKLLRQTRYSGRKKGDDSNADDCSAILKQWDHIADCSKINDPVIAGANVGKILSFAFHSRSDKVIVNNEKEDKNNEEEGEEKEVIENDEDIEDIYVDVNNENENENKNEDEENTKEISDNNEGESNNIDENEKMLYDGDEDIFSDINIE